MSALFISLLTAALIGISLIVVLVVLMQRTSQSGGMGAALGGGAAESAFGADTNNVLTKLTIYCIIAFFLIALGLYLFYQNGATEAGVETDAATLISAGTELKDETAVEATDQAVSVEAAAMTDEVDAVESPTPAEKTSN